MTHSMCHKTHLSNQANSVAPNRSHLNTYWFTHRGFTIGSFHLDKKSLGLGQIVLPIWRLNGLKFTNPNSIFAW